ncbi:hypothetical protein BJ917_1861 [Pseudomonas sp. WPR_5_2]|nr:hypothetical protein BJ917_1861 [Pseudomonas sp. WPR_5_2]
MSKARKAGLLELYIIGEPDLFFGLAKTKSSQVLRGEKS